MKHSAPLSLLFLCAAFSVYPKSHISTQPHSGAVSVIVPIGTEGGAEKAYISAGCDGFLVKWTEDRQGEHYQISEYEIKAAAVSPDGRFIAAYETDGGTVNRIALWEWETLSRKWARQYRDTITSLAFTEQGHFLMVGTATVNGLEFLKAENGEVVRGKLKDATGIVSYAVTSSSEKNAAMYSPAGNLSFYDLTAGHIKQRNAVTQGLSQAMLFNNFLFLAGVKDGAVTIVYSPTGKTLATIRAADPLLLASKNDRNLYYLEHDGKGAYTLKMLENIGNRTVSNPKTIKTFKGPRASDAITCGVKSENEIMLGSYTGALYVIDAADATSPLVTLTEDLYEKILDMAPVGEDFYFLTKTSLLQSSYNTGAINRIGDNPGKTQLISYGSSVILWSKGTRQPVQLFDYAAPKLTTLYTPKTALQSLRRMGTLLVDIESGVSVNAFDLESGEFRQLYTGAGLQDALLANDGAAYVAKSDATNPPAPLIRVDMATGETTPVPVAGNVAFGLSAHENLVYGICVQENGEAKRTFIFKVDTETKQTGTAAIFNGEYADAFTYLYYPALYTNIGQTVGQHTIRSINLSDNKNVIFNRSASMPSKISRNAERTVILNRDGSISWYEPGRPNVLADWYLTKAGQWFEF